MSMILEAFLGFSSEFSDIAKRMFDENRVDVPVVKGKRGGAFCSSSTPDMYKTTKIRVVHLQIKLCTYTS